MNPRNYGRNVRRKRKFRRYAKFLVRERSLFFSILFIFSFASLPLLYSDTRIRVRTRVLGRT